MKLLLMLSILFSFSVYGAMAHSKAVEPLSVIEGIVYLPLKGASATAGYGELKNLSDKKLKLSIVKAEGFKVVELHETKENQGMMKMQKVNSFVIEKNKSFSLKPGGNHIMLFEPTKEFKKDEVINIVFKNDKSEEFKLPFKMQSRIEPHKGKKPEQSQKGHHHNKHEEHHH